MRTRIPVETLRAALMALNGNLHRARQIMVGGRRQAAHRADAVLSARLRSWLMIKFRRAHDRSRNGGMVTPVPLAASGEDQIRGPLPRQGRACHSLAASGASTTPVSGKVHVHTACTR